MFSVRTSHHVIADHSHGHKTDFQFDTGNALSSHLVVDDHF